MEDWKKINIPQVAKIERVAAVFDVWSISKFPGASVTIKILERSSGYYDGFVDVAVKSRHDGAPDWIAGSGDSISNALEDTIHRLVQSIEDNGSIEPDDFEWSAYKDF